ncbi:MAG: hypothetical protein JSR85_04000 [Proteobacteria bacterium]|nr:hypothetical protein [Pseudomonadota bacterium]
MKYKTLAAAAVTLFTAMTADVNADCPKCTSWFNGPQTCGRDFSKLNPQYWACRGLFGTGYVLCAAVICGKGDTAAKQAINAQACEKGGNEAKCQQELEADVTAAISDMGPDLKDAAGQLSAIQAQLKAEADKEAECYEKTGKSCDGQ